MHGRTGDKKLGGRNNFARHHLSKKWYLKHNNVLFMCIFQGHITCLWITKSELSI